jgi:hypothetical protein
VKALLYVYCLCDARPKPLAGKKVTFVRCGRVYAAVAKVRRAPKPSSSALKAHDAVVRGLWRQGLGLLPVRFGSTVESAEVLTEKLEPFERELRGSLKAARDCDQMTLRVFSLRPPKPSRVSPRNTKRPGTEYLRSRLAARDWSDGESALRLLKTSLQRLVREERVQRNQVPTPVTSVYHLVKRDRLDAYLRRALSEKFETDRYRLTVSGPFPPYAFAPEVLS